MISRESDRDLWNPMLSKDITEVNNAGRDFGKELHPSTNRLHMEAFEKKEGLIRILEKELRCAPGLVGLQLSLR